MPMPMNVATGRDEDYKQKIIAFEKEQIEPAFTQYTQGLGANKRILLRVRMAYTPDSEFNATQHSGESMGTYSIGTNDIKSLGNDKTLILNVIKDLYDQEGYKTQKEVDELYIKNK